MMTDIPPENPLGPAHFAERLRHVAHKSGIHSDDPLGPFVEVLARLLSRLDTWRTNLDTHATAARNRIQTQADRSIAEIAAMTATHKALTEKAIQRSAAHAAKMTAEALMKGASRRARLLLTLQFVVVFGFGGAIGYIYAAHFSTQALAAAAELQGALLAEPSDYGLWAEIIRRNNIRTILKICTEPGGMAMTTTGHACLVPIRVDGPPEN